MSQRNGGRTPLAVLQYRCMQAAGASLKKVADTLGIPFTAGDVQAAAATLMISATRDGNAPLLPPEWERVLDGTAVRDTALTEITTWLDEQARATREETTTSSADYVDGAAEAYEKAAAAIREHRWLAPAAPPEAATT